MKKGETYWIRKRLKLTLLPLDGAFGSYGVKPGVEGSVNPEESTTIRLSAL